MGTSYGDGKPSRRFGLQFATAPMSSGTRSGYGWEIGPRCRGSEIARQCGAAVGQERPSGKPGGLFLVLDVSRTRRGGLHAATQSLHADGSRLCVASLSCRAASGTRMLRQPRGGAVDHLATAICAAAILSFMKARTSGGAVSGEPELNGGAGLYSSRSCIASAVFRSCSSDTSVSAKSIPAVTPPPVTRLRSTQTRVLVGIAPKA